jgi:hypothetical protein
VEAPWTQLPKIVSATSTPSEIFFSTGGNIVTCTRAALKPEVNQLVFLAQNLSEIYLNSSDVTDVKVKSTSVILEFLLCLLNTAYI